MLFKSFNKSIALAKIVFIIYLILFIIWCVLSLPFYSENKVLALATALSDAGLSEKEAETVLDNLILLYEEQNRLVPDIFSGGTFKILYIYNGLSPSGIANAYLATQDPKGAKKNVFVALKYLPLREKAAVLAEKGSRLILKDGRITEFNYADTIAFAKQSLVLTGNIVQAGEENWLYFCKALKKITLSDNLFDDMANNRISVKDVIFCWKSILLYINGVDFSKTKILDGFLGEGFCNRVGLKLNALNNKIQQVDTDRIKDIFMLLPKTEETFVALSKYFFVEEQVPIDALVGLFDELYNYKIINYKIDTVTVKQNLEYLITFPDVLTQEQKEDVLNCLNAISAAFNMSE